MRILVLGGTVFLGRAVTRAALARGYEVVCAARGVSGGIVDGARLVTVDRDAPDGLAALAGLDFDVAVDVSRQPSQVRSATEALRERVGHFVFVSSGSVYADDATPGQRVKDAPIAAPDFVDAAGFETYGPRKVACESLVRESFGDDRSFICRAGLVVGPEDPTGRFTYWVWRLAQDGPVLAPGTPDDSVQLVDVRDLADWIILAGETGLAGTYDGICAPMSRRHLLDRVAAGVGVEARLTWVEQDFLSRHGVNMWAGERSLPLWLSSPDHDGFLSRDVSGSLAAGLRTRDVAESSTDTLAWLNTGAAPTLPPPGLTRSEEADLLAIHAGLR